MSSVEFTLNGITVDALQDETILQAAQRHGIEIPRLCHKEGLRPEGNCRACVVEISGERALASSCSRKPTPGMVVESSSERAQQAQRMVLELLASDVAEATYRTNSELDYWSRKVELDTPRFPSRQQPSLDNSHPAIAVNLDACIQCSRCLRACREEQVNDVIGYAYRGAASKIVFDLDDAMGPSSCVACGECVQACPTGALMPAGGGAAERAQSSVDSVCPYCGVGCAITYHVSDNRIRWVDGRDGPANRGRLCVKGRFGYDYVSHPHRLQKPLIRRDGVAKLAQGMGDPADYSAVFREATWEEALDHAAAGLQKILDQRGGGALAGFGSAKGSNEEAYLFQKLVRTGFHSNNVDHCTRLCHASSVAALLEGLGSGAVSNPVLDVEAADLMIVIGSNPTSNHPVAATFMKNAVQAGKTLILMDPRRTPIARYADYVLQFRPDSDVALLSAMIHTIIEEDLLDHDFIERRTEGFDALRQQVEELSPERMATVCGIDCPNHPRSSPALCYRGQLDDLLGHGRIPAHPRHRQCALSYRPGADDRADRSPRHRSSPLRGQNNVQGASDVGLIPMSSPTTNGSTMKRRGRASRSYGSVNLIPCRD